MCPEKLVKQNKKQNKPSEKKKEKKLLNAAGVKMKLW